MAVVPGVGEHVHRQHASGESKLIVVQCFQHTFTLFYRHIGDVADSKRKMMGQQERVMCTCYS